MRSRFIRLAASLALAAFGTIVLVGYVQSAHDEAAAEDPVTSVLVVTKLISRGTAAEDLAGSVQTKELPADAIVEGAVTDLASLEGEVAATDLHPGEQLLASRFQTVEELGREGVPPGLLEVTVRLAPERALGGTVQPGDTVAVLSSFEPFAADEGGEAAGGSKTPNTSHVILHKVLVTAVQSSESFETPDPAAAEDEQTGPDPAPKAELLVTLALDAESVQRVVFTAEFGLLWLSAEPADAPDTTTRVETRGTVYG